MKIKVLRAIACLGFALFTFGVACPSISFGQKLLTIYDGRSENNGAGVSAADMQIVRTRALPQARRAWGNECVEQIEFIDAAAGSFTKANTLQSAVLYSFCEMGHAFSNNGLVIIEGGKVVRNIIFNGGGEHSINALPDINGNGISEIVLAGGATNQGYTVGMISLIEITSSGVRKFGDADVYSDNCGVVERNCKSTGYIITGKPGPSPVFNRETYQKRNRKWVKSGAAKLYRLRPSFRSPETLFRILT